jgi:hypothetical protein
MDTEGDMCVRLVHVMVGVQNNHAHAQLPCCGQIRGSFREEDSTEGKDRVCIS